MIITKSPIEIKAMREGGRILSKIMKQIVKAVKPGISTLSLDTKAEELIAKQGGKPAFKGYKGFPNTLCVSINDEVVHGIPKNDRLIEGGDVVKLDCGIRYNGYFTDMATTVVVGEVPKKVEKLIETTRQALDKGIAEAKIGNNLGEIGHAIEEHVTKAGFSVVRDLVGHGVGLSLHEEPKVPNYGEPKEGPTLEGGMTLAIEPMVNMGSYEIMVEEDGWTAKTKDGKLSAHFEHTVAITKSGPQILTR